MFKTNKPKILTYLGTTPFLIALVIAVYGHLNLQEYFGNEIRFARFKSYMIAHTYGAVIVAFLGGIQWGISLNQKTDQQYFITSNVLALIAWFSLFSFASFIGITAIILAFILTLWVDRHAFHRDLIPSWFWQLRKTASCIVVLSLLALLLINQ